MQKIAQYLKEVVQEVNKVSWPDKETTINKTLVVITATASVAAYLGGLDLVFQKIMAWLLEK
ncbi:MAG: preprotein translocase subunit SecE [Candidatus Pacebacteria bacterium]|nr:preprotein translocase subunit SecE [Candidatus Paceibacterota bacterium]